MRYSKDECLLYVSVNELVMTARRHFAAPEQEDEELQEVGAQLRLLYPELHTEEILREFTSGGYSFLLSCKPSVDTDGTLVLGAYLDGNRAKPKRALTEIVRGRAFINAYAYAMKYGLTAVKLTYVYINQNTGENFVSDESVELATLERFFDKCTGALAVYARAEIDRVTVRIPSMEKIKFPYTQIREGQSQFIKTAYRTIKKGSRLIAGAPTGTGKTMSAIFPAIRALGGGICEKVFYFTPKTTTADAARDAIELLCEKGADIRAIIMTSKERACERGSLCKRSARLCELSENKKIAEAALALYAEGLRVADFKAARRFSAEYGVCPHELMLTYAELCDVVILDFNYLFDPAVYIRRFFDEGGNYVFLFDEAHNLPDRCQSIYSAEIDLNELLSPTGCDLIGEHSPIRAAAARAAEAFKDALYGYVKDDIRRDEEGVLRSAAHVKHVPEKLFGIIAELYTAADDARLASLSLTDSDAISRTVFLKEYFYKIKRLYQTMERFDDAYECFIFLDGDNIRLKLFAVDTGALIADRLRLGRASVFFSATLSPIHYYRRMLGLDRSGEVLEVESPFDRGQLKVLIMDKISTRYTEREDTLLGVCRAIAAAVSAKRGNYMIFSPSFAYSEALFNVFSRKYPKINVLLQRKDMTYAEKREMLDKFRDENDKSYLIGFCVMGGIYSEGIDLAGDGLIGAVVVGIGMPQPSFERESMRAYFD
ncbi:MAG: ATP-dependent DNA helicase [Clostridia bacterium]|nr:ATP-dependent DNA helicase [Clostridia bacterium]